MIWLAAAALILVVVLAIDWRRPLPKRVMTVLGAAFVAAGFLRLAYVEWTYLSDTNKPLDVAVPLDKARTIRLPAFAVARDGDYDIWLQFDRTSALYEFGCLDPDYDGEKPCPPHPPDLDMTWSVMQGDSILASDITVHPVPLTLQPAPPPVPHGHIAYPPRSVANASDQTPRYRLLGSFHVAAQSRLQLVVVLNKPSPRLAPRRPRIIVGLSGETTGGVGLSATLFCVLCVFGGGFMLLKGLVPRKASA